MYMSHTYWLDSDAALLMRMLGVEILHDTSAQLSLGFQNHSSLSLGSDWPVASGEEKRERLVSSRKHLAVGLA